MKSRLFREKNGLPTNSRFLSNGPEKRGGGDELSKVVSLHDDFQRRFT
jgi:hypothetical protein